MQYKIEHNGQSYVFNDVLCRISKMEYLEQFQDGHIYMNPLRKFINTKSSENAKYDNLEGSLSYEGTWKFEFENYCFKTNNVYVYYNNPILCCMKVVLIQNSRDNVRYLDCPLPQKMLSTEFIEGNLSEYGALFFSKEDFTQRMIEATDKMHISLLHGSVTYSDSKPIEFLKPKNYYKAPFHKRKVFEYQSEYRFLLKKKLNNEEDHFDLNISNIRDCSFIIPLMDIQ